MAQITSLAKVFEPSGSKDPEWSHAEALQLATVATPPALQSSQYLQQTYQDKTWGHVDTISIKCWQTRKKLSVLLEWKTPSPTSQFSGPDSFLDRVALLFPSDELTPLGMMGNEEHPATIWSWRSDKKLEHLTAKGPGSIIENSNAGLRADSTYANGKWQVLISGQPPEGSTKKATKLSIAVWSGQHAERGGLKAFVPDWITIKALS